MDGKRISDVVGGTLTHFSFGRILVATMLSLFLGSGTAACTSGHSSKSGASTSNPVNKAESCLRSSFERNCYEAAASAYLTPTIIGSGISTTQQRECAAKANVQLLSTDHLIALVRTIAEGQPPTSREREALASVPGGAQAILRQCSRSS